MSKTNYLETQLLNHVLRNTPYSGPTTVYVGLFTSAPGEAAGGTEVSGGSYARQAVTFSAPAPDSCSNTADVLFPLATADWGTIVAFAIFLLVKVVNRLARKKEEAPAAPAAPSEEVVLLREIRDSLKR